MPTLKLTKRAVASLVAPDPSGKQTLYFDAERRGLGVLVSGVSSSKSWFVQGKISGNTRRVTLAPTNVLDPEEAWERAKPVLGQMYAGVDPKAERRRRARAEKTVREVLDDYLAKSRLSAKSLDEYRKTAERHLAPWLDRPLRSIDGDAVEERFDAIVEDVAARRAAQQIRGGTNVDGRASANGAMQLLRSLWNFQADRDETLGRNPVDRLRKHWHRLDRRTRYVTPDQLPAFYAATMALPSGIQRDLVLLGLFTGMREKNCAALRWEEVDLRGRVIKIAGSRMKNRKSFELPMSDFVYSLLVARRAIGVDGPYVFPGDGKLGYCQSFTYALQQIATATGIRVSPHDLRRTFASVAAVCEIPPVALKLLIAHSTGGDVTAGYQLLTPAQLREAAQKVTDKLKEFCGIEAPEGVERIGDRA